MKIGIIGAGIVGQAIGKVFHSFEHKVVFYDINESVIEKLEGKYLLSSDIDGLVKRTDIIFICVPTPTQEGKNVIDIVLDVCEKVSDAIKKYNDYRIIVIKSSILPGTTEKSILPIFMKKGLIETQNFDLVVNPEFLRHCTSIQDFITAPKIVLGLRSRKALDDILEIYRDFNAPNIITDWRTAEMVKYVNNAFYSTRISFMNEIYRICKKLEIDSQEVISTLLLSKEDFGTHGLEHGHAYSGDCLPKDLDALISMCKNIGYEPYLLEATKKINEEMENEH